MATKGHLLYYPEGKHDILLGKELNDILKSKVNSVTKITYQDLKDLRDNSKLTPGALYRITDYQCTTTQENTQSAGHQFDIVLLALNENKLAEEGWAMEHPTDVYDVTFADGITKKCYIYYKRYAEGVSMCNLVDAITLNGLVDVDLELLLINEANKTATSGDIDSTAINDLDGQAIENCPYNYFQNSNLSAWKVWYCLDNDKSRFAWAQGEEVIPDTLVVTQDGEEVSYIRRSGTRTVDGTTYYKWKLPEGLSNPEYLTEKEFPTEDDVFYRYIQAAISLPLTAIGTVSSFMPEHIEGNGRGVIYRLIDEFNNDIKYDFKNIQFKRKLTDGQYHANGTETWCYTLNVWYNNMCQDASIVGNTLTNNEGIINGVYDNKFGYATAYDLSLEGVSTFAFALGNNVVLSFDEDSYYNGIYSNTIGNSFYNNTIGNTFFSNTIRDYFHDNLIGNFFLCNTIGNISDSNTIGEGFSNNTIGSVFVANTIGNRFYSNTIDNLFFNKTIGDNTNGKNYGNTGVELVTNIKTINNQSLLGSGNITIQGGGGSAVQSDWSQSDSTADDYIKNKPSLATVATSGNYNDLSNKPTIPDAQIQADWNQTTTTEKDYIKNKPTIPVVPTNVSAFTNDAGYLTQHQNIKTVNNTSLVGSGNMNLAEPVGVIAVAGATPTQTLSPNTFYKFTDAVTSLTLTLGSEVSGITNIYAFSLTAGADNPTITLPQGVQIADAPTIANGDYVEFSIMDNKAIAKVWSAS